MSDEKPNPIVLETRRHLKWRSFDVVERAMMVLCGICLLGFTSTVLCDVITREIGAPWLWLQQVTTAFFIYGIFIGAGVATRRADHLYLTAITEKMHGRTRVAVEIFNRVAVLVAAFCFIYYGSINVVQGWGNYRMPSMVPLSYYYAVIPLSGIMIALFTIEQIVNGLRNGFEGVPEETQEEPAVAEL